MYLNILLTPGMWCLISKELQILNSESLHCFPGVTLQILQQKLNLQRQQSHSEQLNAPRLSTESAAQILHFTERTPLRSELSPPAEDQAKDLLLIHKWRHLACKALAEDLVSFLSYQQYILPHIS